MYMYLVLGMSVKIEEEECFGAPESHFCNQKQKQKKKKEKEKRTTTYKTKTKTKTKQKSEIIRSAQQRLSVAQAGAYSSSTTAVPLLLLCRGALLLLL